MVKPFLHVVFVSSTLYEWKIDLPTTSSSLCQRQQRNTFHVVSVNYSPCLTHHFQKISTKTLIKTFTVLVPLSLPASGTKAPGVKPTKAAVKASASGWPKKHGMVDWLVDWLVKVGLLVGCGQGWLIGWLVKVGLISKTCKPERPLSFPLSCCNHKLVVTVFHWTTLDFRCELLCGI